MHREKVTVEMRMHQKGKGVRRRVHTVQAYKLGMCSSRCIGVRTTTEKARGPSITLWFCTISLFDATPNARFGRSPTLRALAGKSPSSLHPPPLPTALRLMLALTQAECRALQTPASGRGTAEKLKKLL